MRVAGGGGATVDYPYNTLADECDVSAARLIHWAAGPGDWQTTAWKERAFGSLANGQWDARRGRAILPYTFIDQAFEDLEGGEADLFTLVARALVGDADRILVYMVEDGSPGTDTWKLGLEYDEWLTSNVQHETHTFSRAAIVGTSQTLEVCWQSSTIDYDANTAESDGSIRLTLGGTVIYDISGIPLYVGSTFGGNNVYKAVGYYVGFGIPGSLGTVEIYDSSCVPLVSERNLITGAGHTVQGSDNLVIGGVAGSVTGSRNVLISLRQD